MTLYEMIRSASAASRYQGMSEALIQIVTELEPVFLVVPDAVKYKEQLMLRIDTYKNKAEAILKEIREAKMTTEEPSLRQTVMSEPETKSE